ncbi:MAG: CBS domain-containing protein [Bacteroidetes bacterium]|nr:MAG: CBS domain-containing protein [Bacteroidota bacterium]
MNKTVEQIMAAPVVTTTLDSTTGYVRELMERKQVSAIPIVELDGDNINLKGIVTTSDLRGIKDESTEVDIIMSRLIESVSRDTPIKTAAKKMLEHDMHHLVVMEEGKIVGIVSSMDFVRVVSELS